MSQPIALWGNLVQRCADLLSFRWRNSTSLHHTSPRAKQGDRIPQKICYLVSLLNGKESLCKIPTRSPPPLIFPKKESQKREATNERIPIIRSQMRYKSFQGFKKHLDVQYHLIEAQNCYKLTDPRVWSSTLKWQRTKSNWLFSKTPLILKGSFYLKHCRLN